MPEWMTGLTVVISALLGALGGFLVSRSQAKKIKAEAEAVRKTATTEAFRARAEAKSDATQAINAAIEATTKLVDSQQRRIDQLHNDVIASEKRAEMMAEKLHAATARIDAAECALREVQENLKHAKETIIILERDLATSRKENELLKNRLLELQDMQKVSETERTRLQGEVDSLSERLAIYEHRPTRTRVASK